MSSKEIDCYRDLIKEDLSFEISAPYYADSNTPVHRWYLMPESCSIEWAETIMDEIIVSNYDFVMDPFCGSGTVALQSLFCGADFLGGDWRSDTLIGTLAKLKAPQINCSEFIRYANLVLEFNETNNKNCLNENPYASFRENIQQITEVQEFILSSQIPISCRYSLLATVYQTMRSFCSSNFSLERWNSQFQNNINIVTQDILWLMQKNFSNNWMLHFGDSRKTDWRKLLIKLGINSSRAKGILLTSPTFVRTSQEQGDCISVRRDMAIQAVRKTQDFDTSTHQFPIIPSSIEKRIVGLPELVYNYLKTITVLLIHFRHLVGRKSLAIIENENPFLESEVFEVDLYICLIAELLGFSPTLIRVVHYVDSPGIISYIPTTKRGSLIYLEYDPRILKTNSQ